MTHPISSIDKELCFHWPILHEKLSYKTYNDILTTNTYQYYNVKLLSTNYLFI